MKVGVLVLQDMVSRPLHSGGLGALHLQSTNLALLTSWVGRIMSPEDLPIEV